MKKKLHIVYEDKEFLVIDKPAKLLTIATEKKEEKTLYHEAREYVKKQNPHNKIFIVHRLDKETSGIILFAKQEELKHVLQENWNRLTKREYLAIVDGYVKKDHGKIINFIKESKTFQVYDTKNEKTGKKSVTIYDVLEKNAKHSLLKIEIKTGRKNQIRLAFSSIGYPIVGDKKYKSKTNPFGRLGLHATKLELIHPKTNKKYCFYSKAPKEWNKEFEKGLKEYETNTHA